MKEKPLSHKRIIKGENRYTLILYNDDYNTFEHVIESLVEICGHDPVQAEQCAIIAHHKGSCEVKSGMKKILLSMRANMNDRNLTCEVK